MASKIFKKIYGRHRYFVSPDLFDLSDWQTEVFNLIELIESRSSLSRVGHKIYLKFDGPKLPVQLMIEVMGLPLKTDSKDPQIWDIEAQNSYNLDLEGSIFTWGFSDLIAHASLVLERLLSSDKTFMSTFQIVLDNEKIALLFFKQNDYSQKRLS